MIRCNGSRLPEKWRKGYHISDNTLRFIFYPENYAVNRCYEAISSQEYQ